MTTDPARGSRRVLKLTDAAVRRLRPPPGGRLEVGDADVRGFGLRVSEPDVRSFFVLCRAPDERGAVKLTRFTLGRYPEVSLAEAREEARRIKAAARRGENVRLERQRRQQAAAGNTLRAWYDRFVEQEAPRTQRRSLAGTRYYLERFVLPTLGHRDVASLAKADLRRLFAGIAHGTERADGSDRAAPGQAVQVFKLTRRLLNWLVEQDALPASPMVGLRPPADLPSRDRVLADDELGAVWRAAGLLGFPTGSVVRLLILTGQRRDEIADLRWSEVDLAKRQLELPAARTKNGRPHVVPLSEPALELLDRAPRRLGTDLVFWTNGTRRPGAVAVCGWSKIKARLDRLAAWERAAVAPRDERPSAGPLAPWRLHDLRRTLVTGMNELGVSPHVVEAVVNHVSGHKAGVAGIYNKALYVPERRAALELWAEHLISRVERIGPRQVAC